MYKIITITSSLSILVAYLLPLSRVEKELILILTIKIKLSLAFNPLLNFDMHA